MNYIYGDRDTGVFLNSLGRKFYKVYLGESLIVEKGLWLLSSDDIIVAEVEYIWADDKTWIDDYVWVDNK